MRRIFWGWKVRSVRLKGFNKRSRIWAGLRKLLRNWRSSKRKLFLIRMKRNFKDWSLKKLFEIWEPKIRSKLRNLKGIFLRIKFWIERTLLMIWKSMSRFLIRLRKIIKFRTIMRINIFTINLFLNQPKNPTLIKTSNKTLIKLK